MSRSNPQDNAPNPAVRWFEWNGEHGTIRYYDKDLKENIIVPLPFTFLLLDQLASVRGWNEASESGIYSNEVRDTRSEPFIVKSFKGETFAEGIYKDIKDRVCSRAVGGRFEANCYIAFKKDGELVIGSLRFKGAALGSWMEFTKLHRSDIYQIAVTVTGSTEGKKGRIVYKMPVFKATEITPETNGKAVDLDRQFQTWLEAYLKRTTRERVAMPPHEDDSGDSFPDGAQGEGLDALTDDDIPF